MTYEVEQKFPCDDLDAVRQRLQALGATECNEIAQSDCYYRHPARDFAKTDEAFRLRRVGDRNFLTYKGPKIDATTKSRREEEVRLADGEAVHGTCGELLRQLGFEPVAVVEKLRETRELLRDGARVEIALDDVSGVGTFVELEVAVQGEDVARRDAAKQVLASLARELGLSHSERRSYLELLLTAEESKR